MKGVKISAINEVMATYWSKKWGKMYGVAEKDVDWALKLIGEVTDELEADYDEILAIFLYIYHRDRGTKPPEYIFEKILKSEVKGKGELVKFTKY